jgi:hypothetical protein
VYDRKLEEGLKKVREGKTVPQAAASIGEPPERLRDYLARTGVGEKQKGRWFVGEDHRIREMSIYSQGRRISLSLAFDESRKVGAFMSAVGQALDSNDPEPLVPFEGDGVTDIDGEFHSFEVRMNVLYRLDAERETPYEQLYRIVA